MLGSGKTTLIKQLLKTAYADGKTAIVENEIGKVNLDAEVFANKSLAIREVTSGCICCTIKSGFTDAICYLAEQKQPDYIVVEPSGVADITALKNACQNLNGILLNRIIMVVNSKKICSLLKASGPFLEDQIRNVQIIYLNFAGSLPADKLQEIKKALLDINSDLQLFDLPLSSIKADTFPDSTEADLSHKPTASKVKIRSTANATATSMPAKTWSYQFHNLWNQGQIEKLLSLFQQEECSDIWRVKGYLPMTNKSIKRIDYVYGDSFQDSLSEFSKNKTNILVIIGKNIPESWLTTQFKQLSNSTEKVFKT